MARLKHPLVQLPVDRSTPVAEVIVYARHAVTKFTGNSWVTSPTITPLTLSNDTDALEASEAAVLDRGRGAAPARNGKLTKVFTDLEALRSNVQTAVDANLAQADEIAAACGMTLRQFTKHQKEQIDASMTTTPGMVQLKVKAVRRGASYEWQFSADGGKTWIAAGTTTISDTTIPGLTVGTEYVFRFRSTYGRVTSDWCTPFPFLVH